MKIPESNDPFLKPIFDETRRIQNRNIAIARALFFTEQEAEEALNYPSMANKNNALSSFGNYKRALKIGKAPLFVCERNDRARIGLSPIDGFIMYEHRRFYYPRRREYTHTCYFRGGKIVLGNQVKKEILNDTTALFDIDTSWIKPEKD